MFKNNNGNCHGNILTVSLSNIPNNWDLLTNTLRAKNIKVLQNIAGKKSYYTYSYCK